MKCLSIIAAVALLLPLPALAKVVHTFPSSVERWGMAEISLNDSDGITANPFVDSNLSASFTCDGKSHQVNGFLDGQTSWKVRFMPEVAGTCTYVINSTNATLDGMRGKFTVTAQQKGNHGPVRAAKVHHFSYADGTPYFLLGTTSYNWLNRNAALQNQTLATLKSSGFNKIRFGLFPKWFPFNHVDPPEFPYLKKANGSFDLTRFNPAFFRNVDAKIAALRDAGIEADIIMFHPYDRWGFMKMDEATNKAWLRYVVARYASYRNVQWTMANEYELLGPRDWNALGDVVRANDRYGHPLGIHQIGVWYDHNQPWINRVIIQDGSDNAKRSTAIARRRYPKPVLVDEYGYEGNNGMGWGELTPTQEVNRHWEITMAGGYASHGETYVQKGGVLWWAAGGVLQGESPKRLVFLKSVMEALPFQEMAPSPELVSGGMMLAKPGSAYLIWVNKMGDFKNFLDPLQVRLAGTGVYKVELIDPWMMKIWPLGYTTGGDHAFRMPFKPGLLRFTAASTGKTQVRKLWELTDSFIGDDPRTYTPEPNAFAALAGPHEPQVKPDAFKPQRSMYAGDFQLGALYADPKTKAVLDKYIPTAKWEAMLKTLPFLPALTIKEAPLLKLIEADQAPKIEAELMSVEVPQ